MISVRLLFALHMLLLIPQSEDFSCYPNNIVERMF